MALGVLVRSSCEADVGVAGRLSAVGSREPSLSFEPNQGQTDSIVKFLARAPGYVRVGLRRADGDYQINLSLNGTAVPQTRFLTVHQ